MEAKKATEIKERAENTKEKQNSLIYCEHYCAAKTTMTLFPFYDSNGEKHTTEQAVEDNLSFSGIVRI